MEKKKIWAMVLVLVIAITCIVPSGRTEAAQSLSLDAATITEGEVYSFKNVSSGWYMNVKHGGSTNGTEINLYPFDQKDPGTQQYVFHIVSEGEKLVQISPASTQTKYLDVRRRGQAFAAGQGICIWEADGDTIKNLKLDMQSDGSFCLSFADYPDYCIAAKSEEAARTTQTQLVVAAKNGTAEQRWILCDRYGNEISLNLGGEIENRERWENIIADLRDVYEQGISLDNGTAEIASLMNSVSTKNAVWVYNAKPKMQDAIKYTTELLYKLYERIDDEDMTWKKLLDIENQLEEFQTRTDSFFKDAYNSLNEMVNYQKIIRANRNRASAMYACLKEYQESLPTFREVYDYALKQLKEKNSERYFELYPAYVYGGNEFRLVQGFKMDYVYNQNNYSKFIKNGKNVGCTAAALATAYSIYNRIQIFPDDPSIHWGENGVTWTKHSKEVANTRNMAENERLETIWEQVQSDIPVILRLNTSSGGGHSVTVIGIKKTADRGSLQEGDFLIADPWVGEVMDLGYCMQRYKYTISYTWPLYIPIVKTE